jgi:hypothetical protein
MKHVWPLPLMVALACVPGIAAAQQTVPIFDHRRLIAENLAKLFSADAQARNVVVSELRQVPSAAGLMWGTCVRLNATGMGGKPTLPRTYVVTFTKRNDIAERRAATGDECAGAKFEPLS